MLKRVVACCSVVQRVAGRCSVMYYLLLPRAKGTQTTSVLQFVTVCCNVLQRVAVCCSALQRDVLPLAPEG